MYLSYDNIKLNKNDIPIFSEKINYDMIFKNDYLSNIVLNYIIDEIIRLIDYNPNKNIKTNIIHFIIDLITNLFNTTFYEISKFNQELSYFYQILYTSDFYLEIQNTDYIMDALDYYSNQEDFNDIENIDEESKNKLQNEIDNNNEEMDGMDMGDEEVDIEGIFDMYSEYYG
jgi:DNA integrity scanning protein DisA with diadenylate cyclase activity